MSNTEPGGKNLGHQVICAKHGKCRRSCASDCNIEPKTVAPLRPKVTIEFSSEGDRDDFMVWLSDGGGESSFMASQDVIDRPVESFDYSRAFEAWGYEKEKHGEPVIVAN
jgi:hypothetical protein